VTTQVDQNREDDAGRISNVQQYAKAGSNQSDTSRVEAYEICQERGHKGDGSIYSNAVPDAIGWQHCKYCGTDFAYVSTTMLHERNQPEFGASVTDMVKENT
jgi:hypothetical protein